MFVEWKLCPFVPPPRRPSWLPIWAGLCLGMGRVGGWDSQGSRRHRAGEGSLPVNSAPSHSPHPKTTAPCHTLVPGGVRCCFLPSHITDQNLHQIKVSPVTPICPMLPAGAGQWALKTRKGLCVSLCPALGRPHSF